MVYLEVVLWYNKEIKYFIDIHKMPEKILTPEKGDKFSIGPGYASALCFTKKGGDESEWTWKNALPNVGQASRLTEFNLYIHGLSDAIDTTEFLEENNNAAIDVDVWNYKTKTFDTLCKRKKYGKQVLFNAGKIVEEIL